MHCDFISDRSRRGPLLAAALFACGWLTSANAAVVASPYVVTVPETDPAQAVQEAIRVELVRLTGMRESVTDPALAPIVEVARQYVQIERSTTSGQIQVLFDAGALRAAIEATGHAIWDLNRPLLWISLPLQDAATDRQMRARLAAAAQDRGLPILIAAPLPSAAPAATAPAPAAAAAPAAAPANPAVPAAGAAPAGVASATPQPSAAELLEAAHRAGANAALVARIDPAAPGALQWTLAAATTTGQWTGGAELAIENATEALASSSRAIDQVPFAEYACQISGVSDLASFVNVLAAVRAAPGISEFTIQDVQGEQLTLLLRARANLQQLQRMLASDRLQANGAGADGVLEYRYLAAP